MKLNFPLALLLLASSLLVSDSDSAFAQIIPDNTLGEENSLVTPQQLRDLIEGGAIRGENLFHSFQQFNINSTEQIYFANPEGIFNILTRVTGANPSDIFGTLGVDGAANLILINPNGINFGADAHLDVAGSLLATTADNVIFDNGWEFSASNPQAPPLLTVNITPGLQLGSPPQAAITNTGNLVVGQNFTLSGSNLFLSGQLHAGNNLTLQAADTVQIRDSLLSPFIASAGNQLLVQGNQSVDIFAFNHPDSGLFSGGDMVLRSSNTIGGDAHYNAGGNFRIERLDGALGALFSPYDPVIRANGDVTLDSYSGASLHILAGGRVEIPGTVAITGADPVNSIAETITLSDGTTISIDGSIEPTLDIRAGINNAAGNTVEGTVTPAPNFSNATSAEISIGDISIVDGGTVLLTNQYQPNNSLSGGITVNSIDATNILNNLGGGSVTIDSRDGITVNGTINTSGSEFDFVEAMPVNVVGNGGEITLLADGNITLPADASIFSQGLLGGNINLQSDAEISIGFGLIGGFSTGSGRGGDINLTAQSIFLDESTIFTAMGSEATGQGGDINITTDSLSAIFGFVVAETFGAGNAGNVTINATDTISLDVDTFITSQVARGATGNGGNLTITTGSLLAQNRSELQAFTFGEGDAGNLTIIATDSISLVGENSFEGINTLITSQASPDTTGSGGNIMIMTPSLSVTNGAQIRASTEGEGNAGNVIIDGNSVFLDGDNSAVVSEAIAGSEGEGGNVDILTDSLSVTNGGVISASSNSLGNAGNVTITATDSISFDGVGNNERSSGVSVRALAEGEGGELTINTGSLSVTNGAQLRASSGAASIANVGIQGDAGNLTINATDFVSFDGVGSNGETSGAFSTVQLDAEGNAGNISINTNSLAVTNGAQVSAATLGQGNAGIVTINADGAISLDASNINSAVESGAMGNGGGILIETGSLSLTNGAQVSAATLGQGNAGIVNINAGDAISLDASNIFSSVQPGAIGDGGGILIETGSLSLTNGARLRTSTSGIGNAGSISIIAEQITFDGINTEGAPSGIFSSIEEAGRGNSAGVSIETGSLSVTDGAIISSSTIGQGNAGQVTIRARDTIVFDGINPDGIFPVELPDIGLSPGTQSSIGSLVGLNGNGNGGDVSIEADSLVVSNEAILSSSSFGNGDAGSLTINVRDRISISNGAILSSSSFGNGNAGALDFTALNSISVDNSRVFGTVNEGAVGNAGSLNLTAEQITLTNNAEVSSSTAGIGNAGNVTLNVFEQFLVDSSSVTSAVEATGVGNGGSVNLNLASGLVTNNGSLSALSEGEGNAGSIIIDAEHLTIADGSEAIVSNPTFQAGNLIVVADNLTLDQGMLSAETGGGEGGANINLSIDSLLLLRNESLITANATGEADGGNVNIDAQFVVAEPPTGEQGSDIVANAISGDGGLVTIDTEGLFGIAFQLENTPLNDITASSEFGAAGIVEIMEPNVDPAQDLFNLSTDVIDASRLIVRTCPTNGAESAQLSEFVVTGRGGLPPSPREPLRSNTILDDWLTLEEEEEPQNSSEEGVHIPASQGSEQIVEAQGWMIGANGQIILVAQPATVKSPHGRKPVRFTNNSAC